MPYVHVQTSVPVSGPNRQKLLASVSQLAAATLGKPESYVMVSLSEAEMLMGGDPAPAALCDVRSIGGLPPAVCAALSEKLCALLQERLGIAPKRVFLNFTEIEADRWGWDGGTFG